MTRILRPVLVAAVALACAPRQAPAPGSATLAVTSAGDVTRVTVEVQPANLVEELVRDGSTGRFVGALNVPAGPQTFTVRAFAGDVLVGTGTATGTVVAGEALAVALTIVDTREPPPPPPTPPLVTSITGPAALDGKTTGSFAATAVDPAGGALGWAWTQVCAPAAAGTFATPGAASTTWTAPAVATTCTLTATATAASDLSGAKAITVAVSAAPGGVDVVVDLTPRPAIDAVRLATDVTPIRPVCEILRTDASATCPDLLPAGGSFDVAFSFHPAAEAGATASLTDDCGGTVGSTGAPAAGATAGAFHWTAPPTAGACTLAVRYASGGYTDVFPVAVVLVDTTPPEGALAVTEFGSGWMREVWGFGPDDVWTVGTVARHWDGATWTTFDTGVDLHDVWGAAPDDVWAVGKGGSGTGVILHWDGTSWQPKVTSARELRGVWGSAANDVWVVGSTVLHFDGTAWTERPTGDPFLHVFSTAWGTGPDDVWVAGSGGVESRFFHWDGARWTMSAEPAFTMVNQTITDLWGSGPDDVWAVSHVGGMDGRLMHWDGTEWVLASLESDDWTGLWGFGPDDVWVAGWRGAAMHWDGTGWTRRSPVLDEGFYAEALWGSGPDDLWLVGEHFPPGDVTYFTTVVRGRP